MISSINWSVNGSFTCFVWLLSVLFAFQTKMSVCHRTVLLTGIPDVMERDILQDLLEIYFQKNSNGGGEIEAFLYNPLGEHISALFEDVSTDKEK